MIVGLASSATLYCSSFPLFLPPRLPPAHPSMMSGLRIPFWRPLGPHARAPSLSDALAFPTALGSIAAGLCDGSHLRGQMSSRLTQHKRGTTTKERLQHLTTNTMLTRCTFLLLVCLFSFIIIIVYHYNFVTGRFCKPASAEKQSCLKKVSIQ